MKTVLLATSLLSVFALITGAAAEEKAPLKTPVTPEALLTALPPATPTWTLVRSEGETNYEDGLKSSAVRVFHPAPGALANPADGQTAIAATAEVKVALSDFGGWVPGDFENFKPGKEGDRERHLIGSYPAISLTRDRLRRIKLLLASRYVVEITFVDLPREKAESWLQTLNFAGLKGDQSVPVSASQHEFLIRYVDELQPARNRQHRMVVSAPQASAPGQEAAASKP